MSIFDAMRPVAALNNLLERERKALLSGDFKTLEKINATKEAYLKAAARMNMSKRELASIKRTAERNRRLLEASARGLKSAKHRVAALRNRPTAHSTYGPTGQMTKMGDKSLTIKRKA